MVLPQSRTINLFFEGKKYLGSLGGRKNFVKEKKKAKRLKTASYILFSGV
jgi:hypothetical protein